MSFSRALSISAAIAVALSAVTALGYDLNSTVPVTWSAFGAGQVLPLDGGVPQLTAPDGGIYDAGPRFFSDVLPVSPATSIYAVCTLTNAAGASQNGGTQGVVTLQASNDSTVWLDWPGTPTIEDAGAFSLAWALAMPALFVRITQQNFVVDGGGGLSCNYFAKGL
jgi:hypothetical protein